MSDPVPAVTEGEATGEIAALFADIRAVYRVGAVNLIWRHLATIPGALPWAWRVLRPLYVDGTISRSARAFGAELANPRVPRVPPETFAALGLTADEMTQIRGVLAAYDRTNSMALIALTALRGGLTSPTGASSNALDSTERAPTDEIVIPPQIPLAPLIPLAEMPPHVAALVTRLNHFGTQQKAPILASMYRHLSHWPPFLALAWTSLAPLQASGTLLEAIATASDRARVHAARLIMAEDPPPAASHAAIIQAIELFIGDVLVKMIVICDILLKMTVYVDD